MTSTLRAGVVYVWEGRLNVSAPALAAARSLLSSDERVRADRFVYDHHRRRYTVAQAFLRRVLGTLTDTSPGGIRLSYGKHGKPFLPAGPSFNQSHSRERIMIAVASEGRLGVDIEQTREVRRMDRLAEAKFAPDEAALLRAAPVGDRRMLFFRIWTQKEAFTKALGVGLTVPLKSFSVDPAPGAARGLLRVEGQEENPADWHVAGLPCRPGAEAALAVDRARIEVEALLFDPAGV